MQSDASDLAEIEHELASLARLAAAGESEDTRMLLARLVRKYRQKKPALAELLDQSLKSSQVRSKSSSVLRRAVAPTPEVVGSEMPVDADSRLSLIRVFDDRKGFAPPILPNETKDVIGSIIQEHKERARLVERGISPTRTAIFVGAPGVGKTLSARWTAYSLGKPLLVLDLTAVMSSLLGKTGNNLRAALDYAKEQEAVLLLDEIDAIAKKRSDESDIGELKRLVTVMLQEVDQWPDTGLLLAATNHPELIDPALWRRFDVVVKFESPEHEAIAAAISRFLGSDNSDFLPWVGMLATSFQGLSLSDVERAINTLRRKYILQMAPIEQLVSNAIGMSLESLTKSEKQQLAIELAKAGTHTHVQIHKLTGVSRDTIRKHAGPSPRQGRGSKCLTDI